MALASETYGLKRALALPWHCVSPPTLMGGPYLITTAGRHRSARSVDEFSTGPTVAMRLSQSEHACLPSVISVKHNTHITPHLNNLQHSHEAPWQITRSTHSMHRAITQHAIRQ